MQSLLDTTLNHLKNNMNNVLTSGSADFSGLDEDLFMKLASRFSNREAEAIYCSRLNERNYMKDSIYCSLIKSLVLPVPEIKRGHFWSLFNVFKCKHCTKLIPSNISHRVDCIAGRCTIKAAGVVYSIHERAPNWNLTQQIIQLKDNYKCNWRLIYWRLWSECHYLFCTACESYYPVIEFNHCRHHSSEPVFSFVDEEGISTKMHPIGRFTCCESKAYRYYTIPHLKNTGGCKVTDHVPLLSNRAGIKTAYSADIIKFHKICKECIARDSKDEPAEFDVVNSTSRNKISESRTEIWHYILEEGSAVEQDLCVLKNLNLGSDNPDSINDCSLQPISRKLNELNHLDNNETSKTSDKFSQFKNMEKTKIKIRSKVTLCSQKCSEDDDALYSEGCCLPMQNINGEDKFFNRPIQYSKRTKRHKKTKCGLQSDQWVNNFSTRYNQDKQREYENIFFNRLNKMLTKKAEDLKTDKIGQYYSAELPEPDIDLDNSNEIKNEVNQSSCMMGYKGNGNDGSGSEVESIKSVSDDSLSSYCSTLNSSIRVKHSRTTSVWNSCTPLAGSYMRIETEFRDPCFSVPETTVINENGGNQNLKRNLNFNIKARKQPTFTIQHHYNRRYSGKWLKNESMTMTKTKVLHVPMLKDRNTSEFYNSMWSFDTQSQELDYLSAMYIPLPITFNSKYYKYYKTIQNDLANEWSDLVELEKSWNAFLCLFFENESLPNKNVHLSPIADDGKTEGF